MAKRIGFIGLGFMGRPTCLNLLKAGLALIVHDVRPDRVEALVAHGARGAVSPRELARDADVAITMVPADEHVTQALLGPDGALHAMRPGATIIQMSTIKPGTLRGIAAEAEARGVRTLDAPISGGFRVATGELAIFVGGDPMLLEEHHGVLRALARAIHHVGDLGAGQAAKLVNNMLSQVGAVLVAEALVFARKAGLDTEKLYYAVQSGTGDSLAWRRRVPDMLGHAFEQEVRGKIDIAAKDLSLILSYGREIQAPTPLSAVAQQLYTACQARGDGELSSSAVVTIYEALAGLG